LYRLQNLQLMYSYTLYTFLILMTAVYNGQYFNDSSLQWTVF